LTSIAKIFGFPAGGVSPPSSLRKSSRRSGVKAVDHRSRATQTRSPQVAFRVPVEVRDRAAEIAAAEGKTVSQLAREALEARLVG
jgi:hypothetical protein